MVVDESRVPVLVQRGYSLPGYVDNRTLVIASSYSGSTEETLSCFQQSLKTGARNLAITTGGKLKTLAEANAVPAFVFDYKAPPRAALPYSLMVLLRFLQRLDLIKDRTAEVDSMFRELAGQAERINETVPLVKNQAKQIARDLHGRLAVIYGGEMLSEVAHRWKTQINENANTWAFHEAFPELDHNAVVGYEFPAGTGNHVMVIMLASSFLSPRVQLRYEVTGRLLTNAGISYRTVRGEGTNRLSEVGCLVLLGDYVSYYLALLNGVDPGAAYAIDYLKSELAKTAGG
jgi:glucose/mannose-6-phosphate isomerase